ncbi:hypothetical protein GAY22_06510 [Neisseria gonorrhoeae]|nr:hypothetical protein GAY22_06510 [Neisseria gonorrhoeae]
MQADLAYAYEHITRDYPDAAGLEKGKKISTVSDYFRNIRTHSIHPRVSVGYDFGGWRIAADYARYRKWNNNKYSVNTKLVKIGGNELFFNRRQHRFGGAFWCGRADGSLVFQLRQHRRTDALHLDQIVHRLERAVLRAVFRNGLRLRRAYARQRLQLLLRSRIDVYRRKGEGAGEQHTEQYKHFFHGFSFKGCKQQTASCDDMAD